MTSRPLRFGIWALVHGSRAAYQDPEEPYDASWERNRDLVLAAERLGYNSTLIAQHTINPHQEDLDQLEAWSAAAAIAALTSRIEIIAAIKPYLYHPGGAGQAGARDREHQPRAVRDQSRQRLEPAGTRQSRHRLFRARRALRLRPRVDHGGVAPDAGRAPDLQGRAFRRPRLCAAALEPLPATAVDLCRR